MIITNFWLQKKPLSCGVLHNDNKKQHSNFLFNSQVVFSLQLWQVKGWSSHPEACKVLVIVPVSSNNGSNTSKWLIGPLWKQAKQHLCAGIERLHMFHGQFFFKVCSQSCAECYATFICGLAILYSSRAPDAATPPMMPYCTCQKLIRNVTVKGSRSSSVEGTWARASINRWKWDTHVS